MMTRTSKTKLSTRDLEARYNPKNVELRDLYVEASQSRGLLKNTYETIKKRLNRVFVYLYTECDNKYILDMTALDYVRMFSWLGQNSTNPSKTVTEIRYTCSNLIRFLKKLDPDKYGKLKNYAVGIMPPKPQKPKFRSDNILSDETCESIMQTLCERRDYRTACFMALLMYSHLPLKCAAQYKVEYVSDDLLTDDGLAYRTQKAIISRDDSVSCIGYVLAKPFRPYFDAWMAQRESLGIESKWLFPSSASPSYAISVNVANGMLRKIREISDIDFTVSRQSFDPFYCRRLVELGFTGQQARKVFTWHPEAMMDLFYQVKDSMLMNKEGLDGTNSDAEEKASVPASVDGAADEG